MSKWGSLGKNLSVEVYMAFQGESGLESRRLSRLLSKGHGARSPYGAMWSMMRHGRGSWMTDVRHVYFCEWVLKQ